jgi:hypothetical protein
MSERAENNVAPTVPPSSGDATQPNTRPVKQVPGWRGRGRGGRGRGQGNNGNRNHQGSAPARNCGPISKGNKEGMNGHVFQCHGENTHKQQFMKAVGVLEEHMNKTFIYPQDLASICKSFVVTELVQPANLSKKEYKEDMGKKMIWETKMKTYMKRVDVLDSNTRAIYTIVWGQSSPMMQSKLESLNHFEANNTACNCIWLLKEIQGLTHQLEGSRNLFISLDDAWEGYLNCRQGGGQSLHDYLKIFQGLMQVLEHYGATLGAAGPYQSSVKDQVLAKASGSMISAAEQQSHYTGLEEIYGNCFPEAGRPITVQWPLE